MRKIIPLIPTVILLASCAYAVDTAVQDITIRTPGAEDAVCYMYVEGVRYRMHPPQTTSIKRSKEDLIVDCLAPGNRRKKEVIEPAYADSAAGNVVTAGAGLAWDFASGALFQYPDVVEVSFIGVPVGPAFIPAQNNPDIRQPEEYILEEFRPGQPRLNEDKDKIPTVFVKRGETAAAESSTETGAFTESGKATMDKGDLKTVIDSYAGELNPAASDGPTPIIPGE